LQFPDRIITSELRPSRKEIFLSRNTLARLVFPRFPTFNRSKHCMIESILALDQLDVRWLGENGIGTF